jgi:hypothetical protein
MERFRRERLPTGPAPAPSTRALPLGQRRRGEPAGAALEGAPPGRFSSAGSNATIDIVPRYAPRALADARSQPPGRKRSIGANGDVAGGRLGRNADAVRALVP